MFKKVFVAVAAAAAIAGTPVVAADLIVDDAVYDPAPIATNWTGFYFGGWIGARSGNINNTECDGTCLDDIDLSGLTGGVTAGYDVQFDDNWVVGAFVTLPLLKPTATAEWAGGDPTWDIDPQWAIAAGVRAGYDMGAFLPYGLVGIAAASVEVTPSMIGFDPDTNTHVGVVLGGGVEYKLDDHLSIDARYMLGLLNSQEYNFGPGSVSSYSEISHNLSIGLNYRF